jgi:class 3 adenylate cyclase/tetratricopeptide (TPR) repeat protein
LLEKPVSLLQPGCGKPVVVGAAMKCPSCNASVPEAGKFCSECGAPLPRLCPACGHSNPGSAKFCSECGAALALKPSPSAAQSRFASAKDYTPKHLAEKILTARAALEGERKQVTVLFADLKGSMELIAERDPEEARAILEPVLDRMMEAVHHYEGTVNLVMGDGIMALFGAPVAHEDHAVRACYAALRMQEAIRRFTGELRHSHGLEVQIRVGLNSGDVVVGAIGSDLQMDYTAVGQTTHLAARMEQLAAPGTVRLTADTLRLAEGYVAVKALGRMPVKGAPHPVEVYELTGAAEVRSRLQAARARGLTHFVGRQDEIAQMQAALAQARGGQGQIVAVVGEPGVGKSRLFFEFVQSHHMNGWLVLEAGSVSYGKATPHLPLIDLLKGYFKIDQLDNARTIRAKVTGHILALDEALKESVPAVLWLIEALPADDPFLALAPEQRRQRTLVAVKSLLLRESQVQPLFLVFEDLHWIDAETQAFLDDLINSVPTAAVVLAVNYRPEYRHGWGGKTCYRQLRIDPLPVAGAEELLRALIGDDPSVAPLKRLLIERTEGNPLFLEESVRALIETADLVGEPGAYRLARAAGTIQVPPTVQTILASRIDRLSPEHKRLLQMASVVGKDVSLPLLEAIADMPGDASREGLAQLQAAEFIYETQLFPEIEYTFKHALTHEVAYGSLLAERRRALHAAIVDAIERLYAAQLAEHVELLAHHAVRGRVPDKAVRYLREAGIKVTARCANREAVQYFESALEMLKALPQARDTLATELDTCIKMGPALIAMTGASSTQVEKAYLRARELVDQLDDSSQRFPALWGLWFVNYSRGQYAAAQTAGERMLDAARSENDSGHLLEAHHALWATLSGMGRPVAAVEHMERGVALYDRNRHAALASLYAGHDPGACCRYHLAMNLWLLGHYDRSMQALAEALRLSEELKHPMTLVNTLWYAAWLHYQRGDRVATKAAVERMLAVAPEYGISGYSNIGILLPWASGARLDRQQLAELRQMPGLGSTLWRRVFCSCVLAELYLNAERFDEGLALLDAISAQDREAYYGPEVHRLEGELRARIPSDAAQVESCFYLALTLAREREEKSLELRAATSLARYWRVQGRHAEARDLLRPIYDWFRDGFDLPDLRDAKILLDQFGGVP